jgi:hypothetical protein
MKAAATIPGRGRPHNWTPASRSVAGIATRWNIPVIAANIVMHHQIRANKTCPGVNFNMTQYLQRLGAVGGGPVIAPPAMTPAPTQLHVLVNANLRRFPRTDATIVKVLSANDTFDATDLTTEGEAVHGNPIWYRNGAGEFLWAGTTDRPQGI